MLYYRIDAETKTGKGFITHDDWEKSVLKFSIVGSVAKVDGDAANASEWAKRNGMAAITALTAASDIKTFEKNGIRAEIAELQARTDALQTRLSALEAVQ